MEYLELIEKAIQDYIQEDNSPLREAKEYVLTQKSHRIRPLLTMAWCEIAGGKPEDAINFALGIELYHQASIIYDDCSCMDNSDYRRGEQCCHKKFGDTITVLLGMALVTDCPKVMSKANAPAQTILDAISIASEYLTDMVYGQSMEFSQNFISSQEIINYKKTSSAIAAACILGVMAAGGSSDLILAASKWGTYFGLAYQLKDDLQDHDGISVLKGKDVLKKDLIALLNECKPYGSGQSKQILIDLVNMVKE